MGPDLPADRSDWILTPPRVLVPVAPPGGPGEGLEVEVEIWPREKLGPDAGTAPEGPLAP